MRRREVIALGLLSLGGAGCSGWTGTSDPHHPGTALGTFHVNAAQAMNTCGQGALGSMASWEFDVKLSRGETTLFWDSGVEVIPGALAEDRVSFTFATSVVVDMRKGQGGDLPPCSIQRVDKASGALDSAEAEVKAFAGKLSYEFAATPGSEGGCWDLVTGPGAVLAELPCAMAYGLEAKLAKAPEQGAGEGEGEGASSDEQGAGEEPAE